MELIGLKVYFILLYLIRYAKNLDTPQEVDTAEGSGTEVVAKPLERTNTFGLPVLICENNICSLCVGARIPFTSITIAGKIIVGYNVVAENTISGEGHLIYTNNSTAKMTSFGLRLSIVLEGQDELQIKLDIICAGNEKTFSIGGEIGTELPALCAPMPATPMYFMFCITIGDFKYFHDDRFIICLRAEIQFCEQRIFTVLYKCLNFSKYKMKAVNKQLKTVSTFSKNQYDAARQTLKSLPSIRKISENDAVEGENNSLK